MKYVFALIMTPVAFILGYMTWVLIIGLIASFLTWDWSLIPNNIFPWQGREINIVIRSLAGTFGVFHAFMPWVMIDG